MPEAAKALAKAARLLPTRARVHYNLGLALQQLGQRPPAEASLLQAERLDPADAATPYALAVFYVQGGEQAKALQWATKAQALRPDDSELNQFVARLQDARVEGGIGLGQARSLELIFVTHGPPAVGQAN